MVILLLCLSLLMPCPEQTSSAKYLTNPTQPKELESSAPKKEQKGLLQTKMISCPCCSHAQVAPINKNLPPPLENTNHENPTSSCLSCPSELPYNNLWQNGKRITPLPSLPSAPEVGFQISFHGKLLRIYMF